MSTVISSLLPSSDPSPRCLNLRHPLLCGSHSLVFDQHRVLTIKHRIPGLESHQYIDTPFEVNARHKSIQAKGESDDLPAEDPVPPEKRSSPAWRKWAVGIALSIILPSYRHRWGPLIFVQSKVDETIETAEIVADIAEDLGEGAQKLLEMVENKIPEQDKKLKEVVKVLEYVATEVEKEAEEAKRLIHKVKRVEEKVERVLGIEPESEEEEEEEEEKEEEEERRKRL